MSKDIVLAPHRHKIFVLDFVCCSGRGCPGSILSMPCVGKPATTICPTPKWWSLVTAFPLIYRESPANYGIRTTSPLALNKAGLFARDGEYIGSKWSASMAVQFALRPC